LARKRGSGTIAPSLVSAGRRARARKKRPMPGGGDVSGEASRENRQNRKGAGNVGAEFYWGRAIKLPKGKPDGPTIT